MLFLALFLRGCCVVARGWLLRSSRIMAKRRLAEEQQLEEAEEQSSTMLAETALQDQPLARILVLAHSRRELARGRLG